MCAICYFKLETWMRNNVKGMTNIRSIVFVVSRALTHISQTRLPAPSDKNVRDLINNNGGTTNYPSCFRSDKNKICSVCVPRHVFSQNLLDLDNCMYKNKKIFITVSISLKISAVHHLYMYICICMCIYVYYICIYNQITCILNIVLKKKYNEAVIGAINKQLMQPEQPSCSNSCSSSVAQAVAGIVGK